MIDNPGDDVISTFGYVPYISTLSKKSEFAHPHLDAHILTYSHTIPHILGTATHDGKDDYDDDVICPVDVLANFHPSQIRLLQNACKIFSDFRYHNVKE